MQSILQSIPIAALTLLTAMAFAQTPSTASDSMAAVAADSAGNKWIERQKFTVLWSLQGSRDQSWTAFPKEGKFHFNSRDYCEAVPADAKFSTEGGKFVILITRTRPHCGVTKLTFDLATEEGMLEVLADGKFSQLPGRTVRLKD
ncbi:hypothetical protein [Ramlibacter sp. AN1133]|uniref:hypothetical protein n=1 Tax=Ramlibacter sp. AN1133 TaxID=3133429 RepID=UPI0030BAA28E